ncbi:hypothetical protein QN277_009341 [Acacia crassicarpa]|uniref:RBR-type E3 ubiquitin transferase n=1 Tax=Acacia crassicarpa TaxID=499986 RepID=A0AAE1JNQ5_9FABA|nr:hypothetical protein QN277_009341 [Acacia crassicarpa]
MGDDNWCSDDECNYYYDQNCDEVFEVDDGAGIDSVMAGYKRPTTQVISRESLVAAQKQDLRRVMEMLSLREHHARTLLIHHRWDVQNLFAVYVEKGKVALFADAGVTVYTNSELSSSLQSLSLQSSSSVFCEICIENIPSHQVTRMECGHYFCNQCWTSHFIVQINEGKSKRILCMAHKCNAICDENIVRDLVRKKHAETVEKFDRFLLESYIEDNRRAKWCPSVPHCGNAIRVEEEVCEVECCCGLQFCFKCLSEIHSPCSCQMFELWANKCRDESESVNWITAHTKPCPKCHKPVEKSGGCNLVSCICRQSFCWICGEATGRDHTWTAITGHSCGRYQPREKLAELAKKNLYRYMHYHNRYKAHMDSLNLEGKLKETMQQKVSLSEKKHDSSIRDYSWVNNGLSRLFRSRRVLCYTYPFAYYMFGGEFFNDDTIPKKERERKQNLFEDQQQQLEANIERLSMFLEEPFDEFKDDKVIKIREKVLNLSAVVDSLCSKMYEVIENDLLVSQTIAPYKSKGIEKASLLNS